MRKSKRQTRILAISSLLTALGVVLLYLGSFFEIMDLTVAATAGLLVLLSVIEMGKRTGALIWLATSLLSLLLLPNKFIALGYVLFFGCYPLVKAFAERLPTFLSWVVKLVFAFVAMVALVLLSHFLLAMPLEAPWMMVAFFALALVTTVVFDIALTKLVTLYLWRLRRVLGIEKILNQK